MARLIPYSRGLQAGSPLAFSLRLLRNSQLPGWLPGTRGSRYPSPSNDGPVRFPGAPPTTDKRRKGMTMATREEFVQFLNLYMLGRHPFSDHAQQAASQSAPEAARAEINLLWDDMINKAYRIIMASGKTKRAPFGPPNISPSGIPLHEKMGGHVVHIPASSVTTRMERSSLGAIPSVFIDDDDSNDAHLGEADTGQIEIFTETDKGYQE